MVIVAFALGCGSGDDNGEGGGCALRTTGLSGEGPGCSNSLECGDDMWTLDCDEATSTCDCTKNGSVEKSVAYSPTFCPVDFGNADFDAHEAAAADACGWP